MNNNSLLNEIIKISDKIFENTIRSNSYLEAGYVFAPYVPLQVSSFFVEPITIDNQLEFLF